MKNKGFTLIELLAVIVILAIIALIAVPIILNIIDSTKTSANERSKELYLDAVEQAIARKNLNLQEGYNPTNCEVKDENGNLKCWNGELSLQDLTVEVSGEKPSSGKITFENGKVKSDTLAFDDVVQEETPTQVFKPQYYSWDLTGSVGTTNAPAEADRLTTPPTGKQNYLGYDVSNDKVSAAYVCFKRNDTEYCLKGFDTLVYDTNVEILNDAYADVEGACSLEGGDYNCNSGSLNAYANSNGIVNANDDGGSCNVDDNGDFGCYEW